VKQTNTPVGDKSRRQKEQVQYRMEIVAPRGILRLLRGNQVEAKECVAALRRTRGMLVIVQADLHLVVSAHDKHLIYIGLSSKNPDHITVKSNYLCHVLVVLEREEVRLCWLLGKVSCPLCRAQ
jgi:hypothetical protein